MVADMKSAKSPRRPRQQLGGTLILALSVVVLVELGFHLGVPKSAGKGAVRTRTKHAGVPLVGERHPRFPHGAPTPLPYRLNQSLFTDRQRQVVGSMEHAWKNYVKFAWGHDELLPLKETYTDFAKYTSEQTGIALTAIESLDTLWLMGLEKEFNFTVEYLATKHTFNKDMEVSVFEVTIRALGGLLSGYELSGQLPLLDKAYDLGLRLIHAFQHDDTEALPMSVINLHTGWATVDSWVGLGQSLSEVTTLQLEFRKLSYWTGDMRFDEKAQRIMRAVLKWVDKTPGNLLPMFVLRKDGSPIDLKVTLGARGDSFYEYLAKQWIMSDKSEDFIREAYKKVKKGIMDNLFIPINATHAFIAEGRLNYAEGTVDIEYKMDHLVCFAVGMFLLGAEDGDARDFRAAEMLGRTCHQMYEMNPTKLGPEIVRFTDNKEMYISRGASHNILRPEAIEAMFYLHRFQPHVPQWREWGWEMYSAIERIERMPTGYTGIHNVRQPGNVFSRTDKMESFFLAETLKYSFLLAADPALLPGPLPLEDWVFNTEAHPLRIVAPPPWFAN